jgi:subtilisin family serine protease
MRPLRPILLAAAAAALAACSDGGPVAPVSPDAGLAPLFSAAPGRVVPGSYVVVLKPGADPRAVAAGAGAEPAFVYTAALNGFAARLNAGQLAALRRHPAVGSVEEDQTVEAAAVRWGLDRIDQHFLPLNGQYNFMSLGAGVRVYVVDSGILTTHPEFGGRAQNVFDATGGNGTDCSGHGTHMAGIVGAASYGVAKGVQLRGVRVLNCNGSGTLSWMIAAVDWVRVNHTPPAVASFSVTTGYSGALNAAVANLVAAGVFTAVAAGNNSGNACSYSPGSVATAFTVAGSTPSDGVLPGSNLGSCVDGFAPGSAVSTWLGNGTMNLSGSSVAAPHVAGVAALYLDYVPGAAPSATTTWIAGNMTSGVIVGIPATPPGTPNRLLFKSTL